MYHTNMLKQYGTSHCLMSAKANVTNEQTETKEFCLYDCAFPTTKQPQSLDNVSISDALNLE